MIDSWNHARDLGQTTAQKLEDNIAKLDSIESQLNQLAQKADMDKAKLDIRRNSEDIDWIKDQLKQIEFKIEKTCAPISLLRSFQSAITRSVDEHDRRHTSVDQKIYELMTKVENQKNRNDLTFKEIEIKLQNLATLAVKGNGNGRGGVTGENVNMAANSQVLITNQKMLLN